MKRAVIAISIFATATGSALASDPACVAKLKKGASTGLLQDMKVAEGGLTVIVDERIWSGMRFTSKEGVVDALNCGILDEGEQFRTILFRSDRTNKIIGKQDWGDLTVP